MKMKSILITGITGYIGSNLARSFVSNCEVFGLVRQPINNEYIDDIRNDIELLTYDGSSKGIVDALRKCKPDVVYHLATYYTGVHNSDIVKDLVDSNIVFGSFLLEAMAECGCDALIYATSVMTCYTGNGYCPQNLYAATKQAFSDMLAYYTDTGLMRAVTLMLSDTYGPGDNRPKILNLIRKAVDKGEHIALSDGDQDYDVVYIDDVVEAFRLAGELVMKGKNGMNEIYQVVPDCPRSLRETVELMVELNDMALDAGWGERQTSPREIRKAVRLYPSLFGWQPKVPLELGLKY